MPKHLKKSVEKASRAWKFSPDQLLNDFFFPYTILSLNKLSHPLYTQEHFMIQKH